jgi:UDP-glucose 4-epimerase
MHNILLTGYSGFVGTHLLNTLNNSYTVSLLGRKGPQDKSLCFHQSELSEQSDFGQALSDINTVIHCAARAHIMNDDAQDPLAEFRKVNTLGTLNLAKQAVTAGVKRFIYISTIKVNGESTAMGSSYKASDNSAPIDPYGQSKAEAEQQLLTIGKSSGMDIVIIRPPLVYGEGVKANFASLMNLVGKGLPLPFRSINGNKRSMVSVYNLVDLIVTCIKEPKAANQIFLVSDDNDLSTAEMVALMAKAHGKTNLALPVPVWIFDLAAKLLNKQDVVSRLTGSLQLDIEHTKNTLNWKPPYSVEHGFRLSVNNK